MNLAEDNAGDKGKATNKVVLIILAVAAVVAGLFFYMRKSDLKLSEYRSSEMGISIERPADWQTGEASSSTATFYQGGKATSSLSDADIALIVNKTPGTPDASQRDSVLQLLKDSLAQSFATDPKDITDKNTKVSGLDGRDLFLKSAKVKAAQENGRARAIILYDDQNFYLILMAGTEKLYDSYAKSFDSIIRSFKKI